LLASTELHNLKRILGYIVNGYKYAVFALTNLTEALDKYSESENYERICLNKYNFGSKFGFRASRWNKLRQRLNMWLQGLGTSRKGKYGALKSRLVII
jgi:hypothetical protein